MAVEPITDAGAKSALCVEIARELPMWFGRPERTRITRARSPAGTRLPRIASRDAFAEVADGKPLGLIALEYHFGLTCCIWWLGVRPSAHRQGLGRAFAAAAAWPSRP
jgi:GNAT superfamily N-acetyltransferase